MRIHPPWVARVLCSFSYERAKDSRKIVIRKMTYLV